MATLFAGHPAALNIPALVVFLLTSLFSFRLKSGRPLLALAAGFIWASHSIEENTSAQLKADLAGTEISLMGTIASIPDVDEGSTKFLFRPHGQDDSLPQLMQMRWYRNAPLLRANQLWRFKVRVLPPRGRLNFSGFDFEKWLFARSIGATGSVRSGELVAEYSSAANSVLALRQNISSRISVILTGHPAQGLVKALAVGDRAGINPEQWQFLAASGTSHLVAISGMHIGMIALFGFLVGKGLFRLIPNQLVATGSKRLGIIFALAFAAAYALLSGFVVPAQRALLLLMVILSGTLLRRRAGTFYSLVLAMTGVLLIDALAPLRTGFWLSFSAVGYLLYAATGTTVEQNKFKQMFRAQWVVILGMLPLTLFWFQQTSLISIPSNLVAIPVVSFIVVPLILAATVLLDVIPSLAEVMLWMAANSLVALTGGLSTVAGIPGSLRQVAAPGLATTLAAVVGVLLVLAPRGLPARWAGLVLLLPLVFRSVATPEAGALEMTVLDVGQGSAALLRTTNHMLLYDTGPGDGRRRQVVDSTILPAIRNAGFTEPDAILVSHADLDHAGGMARLAAFYPNQQWYTSLPAAKDTIHGTDCRTPLSWQWDTLSFKVLHPGPGLPYLGNDSSCVLHVSGSGINLLLPGDISDSVEQRLVGIGGLTANGVLVVPHHGSGSSSSPSFVNTLSPILALISSGYMNRFNLPKPQIVDRYLDYGAKVMSTAQCGAIRVTLKSGNTVETITARTARPGVWRQQDGNSCR